MDPICIVDDESSISSIVKNILKDEGYPVIAFPDAESFWRKLDTMEPSLVLLDIWLPGMDGMQLLKRLHDRFPLLPVIMMSGHAGIEAALDQNPAAQAFFATLNSTNRYAFLFRIQTAKKAETREKNIQKFIGMLERGEKFH
jgi:DNA-binding NtrC family response regulator